MVNRVQFVLMGALPTGAALLCMLWMYHRKKSSGGRANIDDKRTVADADKCNGEKLINGMSKCADNGYRCVSADIDISSRHSGIHQSIVAAEEKCLNRNLPDSAKDSFEDDKPLGVTDDYSDTIEASCVSSSVHECMMVSSDSVASQEHLDESTSEGTVDRIATNLTTAECKQDTIGKQDLMDVSDDTLVQTFLPNGVIHNHLSVDSEEDHCWANCAPDTEVFNTETTTIYPANCVVNGRKDSLDSISDGNSCESHDRNANQRIETTSNKDKNRRSSLTKEKTLVSHSFDFPTELCGRLIGHRGRNIGIIKEKSGAEIFIRAKTYDPGWQTVKLEGSRQQVNKAIDMIRRKFPLKRFPHINYLRSEPDVPVVPAELMQLILPFGVPVEVIVSHVISPNHIFVQQPTHPTFPLLERQMFIMRSCYSVDNVPELPRPIEVGMICAAPMSGAWYRAQVVQSHSEADEYDLKLVDFGGYIHLPGSSLRQIRSDFMSVPFQAIECYLANIIPPKDDEEFPLQAKTELEEMVKGCILQCDVVGCEMDGVQYVVLTKDTADERIVLSRELVNHGLGRWWEM